jgi:hypothetical protein
MNLPTKLPSITKPRVFDRIPRELNPKSSPADKSLPPKPVAKEIRIMKSVDKSQNVSVDRGKPVRTSKNIFSYEEDKEKRRRTQLVSPTPLRSVVKALTSSQTAPPGKPKAEARAHPPAKAVLLSTEFKVF